MRRNSVALFAATLSVTPFVAAAGKATATPAENLPLKEGLFDKTIERRVRLRYLLYLPQEYGRKGVRWPLILYLHGGMGRGNDFAKMAWYPLPRLLREPGHQLPFVVLMPQCPENDNWGDPEGLLALLDEISATHAVDPDRIYLAGYSMGGAGVLRLAFAHPDRFAAVAAMSGFADTSWAPRLKGIAMWFFHGGRDDRVPVRESEEMLKALKAEGADVRFSLNPNGAHAPPSDEDHLRLFGWFLANRRAGPGIPADITKPGREPSKPQNKRMHLTKLRAAPERQDKVPSCAPPARMDAGTASQLIRSVRRQCWRDRWGFHEREKKRLHGKSVRTHPRHFTRRPNWRRDRGCGHCST